MAPKSGREIPWCTIILVAGALTCHSLVLMGNLNTAAMFTKLGDSTKGWSHVGQHLGHSLHGELDHLMGKVTTSLTGVIGEMMQIKSGIDTALSLIGGSTDAALGQVKHKTDLIAFQTLALAAASKEGWPGPRAQPSSLLQRSNLSNGDAPRKKTPAAVDLFPKAENDVVWMMETFHLNKKRLLKGGPRGRDRDRDRDRDSDRGEQHESEFAKGIPTVFEKITYPIESTGDWEQDEEIIQWCIKHPAKVQPALDAYLRDHYDEANALYHEAGKQATEWVVAHIDDSITNLMAVVDEKVRSFLDKIRPALQQIGKWLESFGTKVQTTIEGFSTTLDKVQKIFDQLMKQISTPKGADLMLHDTYNLFDASNTGSISLADLKEVGEVYGITALSGSKARSLVKKYDADADGEINKEEFALFVEDDDISGVMAVVLRAYAKKLAHISGNVGAAKKRDEVAHAVVQYITLVCEKNLTKVGWVAHALSNGSLPKAFTADLLKNMAMEVDNPARLFSLEPGPILVGKMVQSHPDHITETLALMSEPDFWLSEGFNLKDQPKAVSRVTQWIVDAGRSHGGRGHSSLYGIFGGLQGEAHIASNSTALLDDAVLDAMPAMAAELVTAKAARHDAKQRTFRLQAHVKLVQSASSRVLFTELYAGATAGSTVEDPEGTAAMNSGVDAKPETLEFASFLAANSSQVAASLQEQCFDYMGDSSSALDSFATQMQAMVKKTQNFLNTMQDYSSPSGIDQLEKMMLKFVDKAEIKIKKIIMEKVYEGSDYMDSHFNLPHALTLPFSTNAKGAEEPGEIFLKVKKTLDQLQAILPEVINDIKFAKREVSAVSKQLNSIFDSLESKGPPVFEAVSKLYSTMWTAYFGLFASITVAILFYGFWSAGWFGGNATAEGAEGYEPPTGFFGKCRMCCSACTTCMRGCHDNAMCFWSCIILCEVVVLLLFIVAIVLTLVGGIKAFVGASCSSIYFLADPAVCNGVLDVLQGWLSTFWENGASQLADACNSESLLTCALIQEKLMTSILYTTAGSLLASVLSFQMIVNTAQLHEQARWVAQLESLQVKDI